MQSFVLTQKEQDKRNPQKVLEKKIPQYIIGAFSIVAALAWNDLIKDIFKHITTESVAEKIIYKLCYAICATLFVGVVVFIVYKCNILYYLFKNSIIKNKIKSKIKQNYILYDHF